MALPPWLRDRRVSIPLALVLANTLLRLNFDLQGLGPDCNDYAYAAVRLGEGLLTRAAPWWTTPGDHFIRWGIVVPLALSFKLFGVNFVSLALPGIFATGAIHVILYRFLERRVGPRAALLSAVVLLFLPSVDFGLWTAYAHWIAALLSLCGIVAFDGALEEERGWGYVRAGLFCGLASLTWTLSVLIMAGMTLEWLLRRRKDVRRILEFYGAALAVVLADVALLWVLFGDPLYRVRATAQQQEAHIPLWHATFLGNWTAPFQPTSGVGRAMGFVLYLALASSIVLLLRRDRVGSYLALAWLLPFGLMRILPLRVSPLQFLALVEPHLLTFFTPMAAATAGLGLAKLWEWKRPAALVALGVASSFGLFQMILNREEFGTETLYPSRAAYEIARGRPEEIIACSFRTQHMFRFWDGYREVRQYLPIDLADPPAGKSLILICNRRHLQGESMPVSAKLEQRRDRWELLGSKEFQGRIRLSQLLKGRMERIPPVVVDVYRVPPDLK